MKTEPIPWIVRLCCVAGLAMMVFGASASKLTYAQTLGLALICGSLLVYSWLRASIAVRHDSSRRQEFQSLNRRLVRNVFLALVAFAASAVIFRKFGYPGDDRLFLALLPALGWLVLTFDTLSAVLKINRIR